MDTETSSRFRFPNEIGWIVVPLVVFLVAGGNSLVRDSPTFDETAHLPAGLTYLDRSDFRLNPEHPPLSKQWAALPVWLGGTVRPDYQSRGWTGSPLEGRSGVRSKADQWVFGYELLNGKRTDPERLDPRRALIPARFAMLVAGLLLGLLVYAWSRELWGPVGARLTLFLYALSPTMLAHSRLVTTDLPSALGFTLALYGFWRFCREPGWGRVALFGLGLVPAFLIKFSSFLLGPMLAALALLWIFRSGGAGSDLKGRMRWIAIAAVAALATVFVGLWAGYGFRFEAAADPAYQLDWDVVGLKEGTLAEWVQRAVRGRWLPEAYLYGFAYFAGGAAKRLAFLNGEQSLTGWWYYFPEAFLLKTPPALLGLLGWLSFAALRARRWLSFRGWFLVIPIAIYVAISIAGHLNIGHRHLTPIYPLLFVLLGGLPRLIPRGRGGRAALLGLLVLYGASFVAATPRYLSYFNFAAGGPAGGSRYLLDSNVDWGQDLARLAAWTEARELDAIHLAYFGTADPSAYGIPQIKVYRVHDFHPRRPASLPGSGDYVAVSVNLLHGLYYDKDRSLAEELLRRGWTTMPLVQRWLDLREQRGRQRRPYPDLGDWMVEQRLIDERQLASVESRLLSTWFASLRRLEPAGRAGDSIVIYRIP